MKKIVRRIDKIDTGKILLALFFACLVIVPLFRMLLNITLADMKTVFTSPNFGAAVQNSLISAAAATGIALILAYAAALCTERTGISCKNIFASIFVLPMLIPSISHGMGLIILFGNNGVITQLFGMDSHIYGMAGIIFGSVLYSFPVAYLMLVDVMKYEDYAPYEAAEVMGIPKFRRFTAITFPYLRKPFISVVFAVFTMIITDYGVPLMVGGKCVTIASVMYQEVIGRLNFGKGSVYGCLLLFPAMIAFLFDAVNRDKGTSAFLTKPFAVNNRPGVKTGAYGLCAILSILVILPIVSFCILSFATNYPANMLPTLEHIAKTADMKANQYLLNSIVIALCVSIIGIVVSFATAYMTARIQSKASRLLHMVSITSAAIPGVVLGLSYVLMFKGSVIYGTFIILILANLIHFFASPYLMMYNSLCKINENLEAVGHTLGIARGYLIMNVFLPQCKDTLLEMFAYFFVNCMMTISAVSFLATTANKPVALMINQFEAQMQLESAAVVSLAILVVNLIVRAAVHVAKKKKIRR